MRIGDLGFLVTAALVGSACAATMETHPVEQYAVVHAAMIAPGDAMNPAGGEDRCLVAVSYWSRRTDEPMAGPPLLDRMAGARPGEGTTWIAPSFETDDAFRGAGFRRVSSPKLLAALGQDATIFVGETIRIPNGVGTDGPRSIRVGFETRARPTPIPDGGIHMVVDSRLLTLRPTDATAPVTFLGGAADLDLPAGYAAILRLDLQQAAVR